MHIAEEVRQFITENFLFGRDGQLRDDDSFLDHGVIDSTGVLELVAFIEEHFGVKVRDEDLIPANLDSIKGVQMFVERHNGTVEGVA